jgi:hypothetical protein
LAFAQTSKDRFAFLRIFNILGFSIGTQTTHQLMKSSVLLLLTVLTVGCTSKYSEGIEQTLSQCGKQTEVESALEYYTAPTDSLKRKAIHFLIEFYPPKRYSELEKDLLVENVELAFEAWKKPWANHLNFDEFKELILPFHLERDSTGTFWRKRFMQEYSFIQDSLRSYPNHSPTIAACIILNNALKTKYAVGSEIGRKRNPVSFNAWQHQRTGDCAGISELTNQIMHSVGIPTAVEFTPQWANNTDKHYWTVVLDGPNFKPFAGTERGPGLDKVELVYQSFVRKRSKVFRIYYAHNPQSLRQITTDDIPPVFDNPCLYDVSIGTIPTQSVRVILPDSINDDEYVYLSVFARNRLNGIAWAKRDGNNAKFEGVRSEVLYVPTVYQDEQFKPVGLPFILKRNGSVQPIEASRNTERVVCTKKYPVDSTNMIKVGDQYQLLYWNRSTWKSVGSQVATEKKITFEGVPQSAVLILRDLTRGRKERVFRYENNKQIFW